MAMGQKENPWGPQVLDGFALFFLLPIGFLGAPFLTHTHIMSMHMHSSSQGKAIRSGVDRWTKHTANTPALSGTKCVHTIFNAGHCFIRKSALKCVESRFCMTAIETINQDKSGIEWKP